MCKEHVVYAKWMSMMKPLDVLNACASPFLKVGSMESMVNLCFCVVMPAKSARNEENYEKTEW